MSAEILNRALLPGNGCFGCGHENPQGLRIEIVHDEDEPDRLLGTLTPSPHMTGFPGVVHGGVIYSALDCLATWVTTVLRKDKAFWVLRSASVKYHRAAHVGKPISLVGTLTFADRPGEAVTVHAEARNHAGELIAEGDFKQVPLTETRFLQIAGLDRVPENWRRLFVQS